MIPSIFCLRPKSREADQKQKNGEPVASQPARGLRGGARCETLTFAKRLVLFKVKFHFDCAYLRPAPITGHQSITSMRF